MRKSIQSKICILIISIKLMSLIVGAVSLTKGKKSWSYELKSISSTSSDYEKFKSDLSVERISRGVYAISGTLLINYDIVEGDSNYLAAKSFRSTQGGNDFKPLPFQVPEAHFLKILNTYYKDVLMESLAKCSDMPYFEDTYQPPFEKKAYTLEACQFSNDGLPDHLQEGTYKVSMFGSGEVQWQIDVIFEVMINI